MPNSNLNYSYIDEQDYLEGEKQAKLRHEYIDGQIYAMAGTSKRHNRIAGNLYRALIAAGQPKCDVYMSDVKVHIERHNSYYCYISLIYRQKNGYWWVKNFDNLEDTLSLPCPKMELKVATIYENIQF